MRAFAWMLACTLMACGESDEPAADSVQPRVSGSATGGSSKPAKKELKTVDPATVGSIAGLITTKGTPPTPKLLSMSSTAFCVQSHVDAGGVFDDRILVTDGKLQNVFVWVKDGLEDYRFEVGDSEQESRVTLDQEGCLYTPRIVGVQLGQEVFVTNSDGVMHNVHSHPDRNRPQNIAQTPGSNPRELVFRRPEVMVKITCDVHAWMSAWIGVVDHPYFALTGADGSFRLEGLPPGEYTLGVWHEKLGEQEARVVVGPGEDVTAPLLEFVF